MRCPNCRQNGLHGTAESCPNCGAPMILQADDALREGTKLDNGRFRIERMLGRGGFGITYRAFDNTLNLEVVVKEFFPLRQATRKNGAGQVSVPAARRSDYERALSRFLEEARILAKITQENVVRVYHYFKCHNTAYIVMQMVDGRTLRELLGEQPRRRFSSGEVEQIVGRLVIALDALHGKGVLHLDISSDNVMRTGDGKIVLIDFGAARWFLRDAESHTNEGAQQSKRAYAAPEMAGRDVGPRSDLFELAMMAHELLTGTLPPSVEQRVATRDMWRPRLPDKRWQKALARALHLRPEMRPPGVREWWEMYHREGIVVGTPRERIVLGPRRVPRTEPERADGND